MGGRREGDGSVFTEMVRALGGAEAPATGAVERLCASLRAALAAEIRRRGLWDSPPSYLGVYGARSWRDALDEMVGDCFCFIFVDRLRGLSAQLRVKPNVDGLVRINVRHFVHEAQKRHDPVGFRVFVVLQAAVRRLLEEGRLQVWSGHPEVRNDSVLGFGPMRPGPECPAEALEAPVARWADELMPELVTARGSALQAQVAALEERLGALGEEGLVFRFKSLVDRLKVEVRSRWAVALESEEGALVILRPDPGWQALVARMGPQESFEDRESFERLQECLAARIEAQPGGDRTRGYLRRLLDYLVQYADGADGEDLPSRRQLARVLDIPRDRLPELFEVLGGLVGECRGCREREPREADDARRVLRARP